MAEETVPPALTVIGPSCRHLRSKAMYVYTDGASQEEYEESDSTNFWCLQSMKAFGPDDEPVTGRDCRNATRSCYEPT